MTNIIRRQTVTHAYNKTQTTLSTVVYCSTPVQANNGRGTSKTKPSSC